MLPKEIFGCFLTGLDTTNPNYDILGVKGVTYG